MGQLERPRVFDQHAAIIFDHAESLQMRQSGLPPLKWSDLKYGFDHGGEEEWLGNGIVLKR